MKRILVLSCMALSLSLLPIRKAAAQFIIGDLIKLTITKVIKAIDLQVQRLQNNTVWLQNTQKVVENSMSQLHLNEIAGWVQKQKDLYGNFYNELWQVKTIITDYHRIKEIIARQTQLVNEYNHAWGLLRNDTHLTAGEISYMSKVYGGILDGTLQNINQLLTATRSFSMQMSDAQRMETINQVAMRVDESYSDLHRFNTQNSLLSLSRAKDENDAQMIKWMYGIK
ncbi:MAG: conjugal transfer protein TraI [Sphingobacteriia bacterium]|nr:conjugal transfer protein TraI [Sphingobacteriia bacterium]